MILLKKIVQRKKEVKLRRNFLPTFIITIFLWFGTAGMIYFVDPYTKGALPLFFLIIFFTLLFTLSILFINTRRGFLVSLAITVLVILKYFGLGSILNLLLIAGIYVVADIYLSKNRYR